MKKKVILILIILGVFLVLFLGIKKLRTGTNKKIVETTAQEQTLVNKVIVIDPGHGGFDNGATYDNVNEDELNLKISLALKEELEARGATVYLTRDEDYDMTERTYNYSKQDDMYLRALKIDSYSPDFFVSIHLNASSSSSAWGSQVFYYAKSTLGNLAASIIHTHMKKVTGSSKRIQTGDFYILRSTGTVGVLIECGFISNSNERGQLSNSSYHVKLATSISDGIEEYFQTDEYKQSSLEPEAP